MYALALPAFPHVSVHYTLEAGGAVVRGYSWPPIGDDPAPDDGDGFYCDNSWLPRPELPEPPTPESVSTPKSRAHTFPIGSLRATPGAIDAVGHDGILSALMDTSGEGKVLADRVRPRIYVASLSDYNAGRLRGRWIDAGQSADAVRRENAEMLAESPEPGAEEWATLVNVEGADFSNERVPVHVRHADVADGHVRPRPK